MAKLQSTQETQERKRRQNAEQPPALKRLKLYQFFRHTKRYPESMSSRRKKKMRKKWREFKWEDSPNIKLKFEFV